MMSLGGGVAGTIVMHRNAWVHHLSWQIIDYVLLLLLLLCSLIDHLRVPII